MDFPRHNCEDCCERYLCHCLQVTEQAVVHAVTRLALATVHDVRAHTGAGEGCTSCHARIRDLLEEHTSYAPSAAPICSVR